jgi:hypothetical protein
VVKFILRMLYRWEETPAHTEEEVGLASDTVRALLNGRKSLVVLGFFWK